MLKQKVTRRYAWARVVNRFALHIPPPDRGSTLQWGRHFLPEYYTHGPSTLHEFVGNVYDDHFRRRGQRAVIIGPRGGAKSVCGNLTPALKAIVEGTESYILIVSDTESQAIDALSNIKLELLQNDTLADDYPHACGVGSIWKENYIRTRNGVVVHAVGTGTKIRGRRQRQNRPSLIICDDIENDDHVTSQHERTRVELWFNRTLMNMGDSRTNVMVLGSALHRDSLLMKLMKRAGWITRRVDGRIAPFRAIEKFPKRMDLWDEWERIFNNHENEHAERDARKFFKLRRREMLRGVKLCWPDREPLYDLMKLRAEIGASAFDAEKQGNPIDPSTCEWPENYFNHDELWFDEWPEDFVISGMALDPSKGKTDKRHDYSSIAYGGVSKNGIVYIDVDIAKRPVPEIVTDFLAIWKDHRPDVAAVETNQFQELLAEDIDEAAVEAGYSLEITPLENWTSKVVRIRRLSSLFKQKRIRFKRDSDGVALALTQCRDFPNGDHDDGPDSIEMLCRLMFQKLEDDSDDDFDSRMKKIMGSFQ